MAGAIGVPHWYRYLWVMAGLSLLVLGLGTMRIAEAQTVPAGCAAVQGGYEGSGQCGWIAPDADFNPLLLQRAAASGGVALQLAIDEAPPVVTLSFPAPNAQGWYVTPSVTGTVSATDQSGVTAIECSGYGVALGPMQTGTATTASRTVTVTGDGPHFVTCTATDGATPPNSGAAAGSTDTATVQIDSEAPELHFLFDPVSRGVVVSSADTGLTQHGEPEPVSPVTCSTQRTGQVCIYRAVDQAGNSTTLTLQITKTSTQTRVRVVSYQFSGKPVVTPLTNEVVYDYPATAGPLTQHKQCLNVTLPPGVDPSFVAQLCLTWSNGRTTVEYIKPARPTEVWAGRPLLGMTVYPGAVMKGLVSVPLP